jgi:hypothetical protein
MLTYAEIRAAHPGLWIEAGDEWLAIAQHAWTASDDLKTDVHVKIEVGWVSVAGQQAASNVADLVDQLRVASFECRASGLICKGLGHALQIAQDCLNHAIELAAREGLSVDDEGRTHLPIDPMFHHDRDWQQPAQQARSIAEFLISTAVSGASQAEETATRLLNRFAGNTDLTDIQQAERDLGDASRAEVDMLTGMVPAIGGQKEMAAWWASLSADDRHTLTLAVPGRLEDRSGIPGSVQSGLRSDQYDGAKVATWAAGHWNDTSDDPFQDNCTNFVSDALEGGGVPQRSDFWIGNLSDDSWSKGQQTGIGFLDEHDYSHSGTWAQAQDSYDFWRQHGQEVSPQDVRPGDIIYWEQDGPGGDHPPGTVHHSAVVTAVVDGDIRYTQHSGEQLNASLDGREPEFQEENGRQKIHIIRPRPDW